MPCDLILLLTILPGGGSRLGCDSTVPWFLCRSPHKHLCRDSRASKMMQDCDKKKKEKKAGDGKDINKQHLILEAHRSEGWRRDNF